MEAQDFRTNIFELFDKRWALVTAGNEEHFNSMTISWGSLGTIWGAPMQGKPIVTVYISPLRYTYEVLNGSDRFTVSFFKEGQREDLVKMGTRSGREGDPLKGTRLTPVYEDGFMTYREAELTLECRKLYQQTLDKERIPASIRDRFYGPDEQAHRMYIGEVVRIREGKK